MGRFQVIAISTLGLANAADAIEVLCIGFILPALDPAWNVSGPEQGVLSAAVFAGMLVGGLAGGALADSLGRRTALALALTVNLVFAAVAAAAPNWAVLAAARALAGIGVGASVPPVFTLANELLPPQSRGFWLSLIAWAWTFGQVITAGLAWLLIGKLGLSWRVFAAAAAAPSAVALVSLLFAVTESPRFLASRGRLDEAAAVIARIAKVNGRGGRELPSLHPLSTQAVDGAGADSSALGHQLGAGAELVRMPSRVGLLMGPAATNGKAQHAHAHALLPAVADKDGRSSPSAKVGSPVAPDSGSAIAAGATSVGERSPLLPSGHMPILMQGGAAAPAADASSKVFASERAKGQREDAGGESAPLVRSVPQAGSSSTGEGAIGDAIDAESVRTLHSSALSRSGNQAAAAIRGFLRATGMRAATLFSPSLIRGTLCMLCVWAVLSLAWYGLGVWLPTVLAASGLAVSPYADAFIAAAAAVPGNAAASWLLDRAPRRLLLAGSMLATGACVIGVALGRSEAAVLTASCMMNAVSVVAWACTNVLSTEVFPTSVRSSGLGLLSATGRAGSIAGQLLFGHLVQKSATALLVAVASLLAAGVVAALLLPSATATSTLPLAGNSQSDGISGPHEGLTELDVSVSAEGHTGTGGAATSAAVTAGSP